MSYLTKICIHNVKTIHIEGDRRYARGQYSKNIVLHSKEIPDGVSSLMRYTETPDEYLAKKIKFFLYEIMELPKGLNYDLSLIDKETNKTHFYFKW